MQRFRATLGCLVCTLLASLSSGCAPSTATDASGSTSVPVHRSPSPSQHPDHRIATISHLLSPGGYLDGLAADDGVLTRVVRVPVRASSLVTRVPW